MQASATKNTQTTLLAACKCVYLKVPFNTTIRATERREWSCVLMMSKCAAPGLSSPAPAGFKRLFSPAARREARSLRTARRRSCSVPPAQHWSVQCSQVSLCWEQIQRNKNDMKSSEEGTERNFRLRTKKWSGVKC